MSDAREVELELGGIDGASAGGSTWWGWGPHCIQARETEIERLCLSDVRCDPRTLRPLCLYSDCADGDSWHRSPGTLISVRGYTSGDAWAVCGPSSAHDRGNSEVCLHTGYSFPPLSPERVRGGGYAFRVTATDGNPTRSNAGQFVFPGAERWGGSGGLKQPEEEPADGFLFQTPRASGGELLAREAIRCPLRSVVSFLWSPRASPLC